MHAEHLQLAPSLLNVLLIPAVLYLVRLERRVLLLETQLTLYIRACRLRGLLETPCGELQNGKVP